MASNFDPDAYLSQKSSSGGFDPDSYLAQKSKPETAQNSTEALLTNKPTRGFIQNLTRSSAAMAGALAAAPEGIALGAEAGTAVMPGIGTAIGGALGGLGAAYIGGVGGESARQAVSQGVAVSNPKKNYPVLNNSQLLQKLNAAGKEQALNQAIGMGIGAAMPYANKAASAAGRGLEGISGLEYKTPGVLKAASNDPSLIFGPNKEEAGLAYEAIKDDLQVRPAMLTATSSSQIIDNAKYALENGDLSPQEALIARRALDDKFGGIPASTSNYLRPKFDAVAKTISAEADEGFKRALKSDALRTIFAVNKLGGTSVAKLFLGGLTKYGSLGIASSPLVQGLGATATGIAGRVTESAPNVIRGAVVSPALKALFLKRQQDQENNQ